MTETSGPSSQAVHVVALAGGVGGAKLAYGLARVLPPQQLTIVVNTADDFEHFGLHISPDLDTVMYTLAGTANPETGWGIKDETWSLLEGLKTYGGPTWFRLGDRDVATHLMRTQWLREGKRLSWITRRLARRLHVRPTLLPMSDDPVRTILDTSEGELSFQEYFVRRRWQPVVHAIRFAGIEEARPLPAFLTALRRADVIVFCPSNPFVSLDPILNLRGVSEAIRRSPAPKVGVSPIVGGRALKGPAAKMLKELGYEPSAAAIAHYYHYLLTTFVIDHLDAPLLAALGSLTDVEVVTAHTVMRSNEERIRLAGDIMRLVGLPNLPNI